jgi:hypothetical protein
MTSVEQEQAIVKRSSLILGDLLLVKQGMAGKVPPFEQMRGTVSFPFKPGKHQRVQVKVIDFLGNEFLRVMKLQTGGISYGN